MGTFGRMPAETYGFPVTIKVGYGAHPPTVEMLEAVAGHRSVTVVPSSLLSDDAVTRRIIQALRDGGVEVQLVTPRPTGRILALRTPAAVRWQRIAVGAGNVRIDGRIVSGFRIGVVTVDAGRERGPFALDLPSHFLHPLDRARLIVSRDRPRVVADVAVHARMDHLVVVTPVENRFLWLATGDLIAAELWSLALAERFLPPGVEMQGPWEDPTVQRATERDLGARIPADMRLEPVVIQDDMLPGVRKLLSRCCRSLGMAPPRWVVI